jgi:sigma 54 modulation/S30EA-like ribosomal protein
MDHLRKKYWTAWAPHSRLIWTAGGSIDAEGGALRIAVTGRIQLSDVLRERLTRRVLLALSRFGPRLRKVTVRLAEPANPLGGVDRRCRIRAWLQDSDDIHAEAIQDGFEAAVARAAARLAKRVDSALEDGTNGGADRPAGGRRGPLRGRRRRAPSR